MSRCEEGNRFPCREATNFFPPALKGPKTTIAFFQISSVGGGWEFLPPKFPPGALPPSAPSLRHGFETKERKRGKERKATEEGALRRREKKISSNGREGALQRRENKRKGGNDREEHGGR